MPSLFEPCGLNQMYSMKYGTLPIVRAVGGLVDSVKCFESGIDAANGFMFGPAQWERLLQCLHLTKEVFSDSEAMERLIHNAMSESFTWELSAQDYLAVYRAARGD